MSMLAWSGMAGQQSFPTIRGTTLADKTISIPQSNGKFSVIAIAFHKDAENSLKNWLNPLYDSFIKKESGDPFDMSEWMDVNFIFIPMIQGFRRVAEEFKKNTDEQFWPYIMDTEKTDVSQLQQSLGVKENREPYFYVVDKNGKVVTSVHGAFSPDKLSKLEDAVE
jgi:hypothetical protein